MTYKEYLEHSKKIKISKNFTQYDICHSDTALSKGINNIPPVNVIQNATILAKNLLEAITGYYNKPLAISCIFRCEALNKLLGGAVASQHETGEACDFTISGIDCKNIFNDIISGKIKLGTIPISQILGQLIYEVKTKPDGSKAIWIHISNPTNLIKKEFLTSLNGHYTNITKEIA